MCFLLRLHLKCQKAIVKSKKKFSVHAKTTVLSGIFTTEGIKIPYIMKQSPITENYLINPVPRKRLNTLCEKVSHLNPEDFVF